MNRRVPRIVMLCGDGPSSWFMYNALAAEMDIAAVVVETKPLARAMIRYRVRKLGWPTVIGQLLFIALNRVLARFQRRRVDELIRRYALRAELPPAEVTHRVHSINDAVVCKLLKELDPDAVVVNGTRIISRTVLHCIDRPFINTHVGITPRYRGVHGGYWALANGDAENCGVTVHLVDAGVDTGGVLYQARISIEDSDGFNTYPLHQLACAIPLMKMALRDTLNGTLAIKEGTGPSTLWYHPTLTQYLRNRLSKSVR
jgi:phosphoribosylglycinamide formyltransferase-1